MISDWHAHLDLFPDPMKAAYNADSALNTCLCVTTSPSAWQIASKRFVRFCHIKVALGLHPELVEKRGNEIGLFEKFIRNTAFVGEIGLDGKAGEWKKQIEVFSSITEILSAYKNKIVSIHTRGADTESMSYLKKITLNNIVILHWFSGNKKNITQALDMNCYFSINPAMCKSQSGIDRIKAIPLNRILLESDAPFSVISGTYVLPDNLVRICNNLSQILGIEKDKIILQENVNTKLLLNIAHS